MSRTHDMENWHVLWEPVKHHQLRVVCPYPTRLIATGNKSSPDAVKHSQTHHPTHARAPFRSIRRNPSELDSPASGGLKLDTASEQTRAYVLLLATSKFYACTCTSMYTPRRSQRYTLTYVHTCIDSLKSVISYLYIASTGL
jgi:hypothetical protein